VVPCRIDSILQIPGNRHQRSATRYHVTNLVSGRKTIFKSAAKFRQEAAVSLQPKPRYFVGDDPQGNDPLAPSSDTSVTDPDLYLICPNCFAQDEGVVFTETGDSIRCLHCQVTTPLDTGHSLTKECVEAGTDWPKRAGCNRCLSIPCVCQDEVEENDQAPTTVYQCPICCDTGIDDGGPCTVCNREGEQRSDPTWKDTDISPRSTGQGGADDVVTSTVTQDLGNVPAVTTRPNTGPASGLGAKLAGLSISQKTTRGHIEVRALAGTGKTTTAIEGLANAKGMRVPITPSDQQEAVWEAMKAGDLSSVRLSSFSTGITNTLKERVVQRGLDQHGVEAQGIHSLGFGAVRKAFGYHKPSAYRVEEMCCQALGITRKSEKAVLVSTVSKLTSLCKQTMSDPKAEKLAQLMSYYDIDWDGPDEELAIVYQLVPEMLRRSRNPESGADISFDDQIWLPLIHNLPIFKVETQVVDEAQDLNRMQQELMYLAGDRLLYIGDPNQAIYGFAGADSESMDRMRDYLMATSLPLTVTRRCGRAIVLEAQEIVPDFEAHPSNPDGLVGDALYPIQQSAGRKYEVAWEKSYCSQVRDGDFILCRVNAPLVSQCFRFLKKSIPATILGRDIGQGLANIVKRLTNDKTLHIVKFLFKLQEWTKQETERENARKFPSENRLISIQDRHECLESFAEDATTTDDLLRKIDQVFTTGKVCPRCGQEPKYDTGDPVCYKCKVPLIRRRGVQLSSIHKAKGLEAERVFFLRPRGGECPHPMAKSPWQRQQERNLLYVGITRAIRELIWVE
jgi:DNA helicase-2/ATP-dependent DNA helicase PcrA